VTGQSPKRAFAARPTDPESWIRDNEVPPGRRPADGAFTAELRGRIKVTAFQRGITVADMLRDLLAREFPASEGDPS
jgi:hypothetical protein